MKNFIKQVLFETQYNQDPSVLLLWYSCCCYCCSRFTRFLEGDGRLWRGPGEGKVPVWPTSLRHCCMPMSAARLGPMRLWKGPDHEDRGVQGVRRVGDTLAPGGVHTSVMAKKKEWWS